MTNTKMTNTKMTNTKMTSEATSEAISVSELVKHFHRKDGTKVRAIDDVSISVKNGEFLVLLGPSGCGKTTLLRCLAGLETPDSGQIVLSGKTVFSSAGAKRINVMPEKRNAAMLFQSYALWPHMKIRDIVAYPLRADRATRGRKKEIAERVQTILDTVECGHLSDQYPGQVSGGQQQRIALARALVKGNPVVFFDEPLSNVDARLRDQLRLELKLAQERLGFSAIYVTHDQAEALALADRVAVLRNGVIAQIGTPREIYDHPTSAYVARFIGHVNEVRGKIVQGARGRLDVETPIGTTPIPSDAGTFEVGDSVIVMMRPAGCELSETEPTDVPLRYEVLVKAQEYVGSHMIISVEASNGITQNDVGETPTVWLRSGQPVSTGKIMWMSMPESGKLMIVPDDSADSLESAA